MKEPKYPHILQHIGRELRRLRGLEKLQTTATVLRLDHSTISQIESGNYGCLKVETLYELARNRGVPMARLLPPEERDDGMRPPPSTHTENAQPPDYPNISANNPTDKPATYPDRENHRMEKENCRLERENLRLEKENLHLEKENYRLEKENHRLTDIIQSSTASDSSHSTAYNASTPTA